MKNKKDYITSESKIHITSHRVVSDNTLNNHIDLYYGDAYYKIYRVVNFNMTITFLINSNLNMTFNNE
jgi:hypothetical protein